MEQGRWSGLGLKPSRVGCFSGPSPSFSSFSPLFLPHKLQSLLETAVAMSLMSNREPTQLWGELSPPLHITKL